MSYINIKYFSLITRCTDCNKLLTPTTYGTISDQLYCKNHYEQRFRIHGNYSSGF